MRRTAVRALSGMLVVVLATLLVEVWAVPAQADDPMPLPLVPSGVSAPPELFGSSTEAPDAVQTELPGPTGSLAPPSQRQINDARDALRRLKQGRATRTPAPLVQVAAPEEAGSVAARLGDQAWWTIGAAALVLLVASETTRISVRRAKHRKEA